MSVPLIRQRQAYGLTVPIPQNPPGLKAANGEKAIRFLQVSEIREIFRHRCFLPKAYLHFAEYLHVAYHVLRCYRCAYLSQSDNMEMTAEAIIALIALVFGLPSTTYVIWKCRRRRRRCNHGDDVLFGEMLSNDVSHGYMCLQVRTANTPGRPQRPCNLLYPPFPAGHRTGNDILLKSKIVYRHDCHYVESGLRRVSAELRMC